MIVYQSLAVETVEKTQIFYCCCNRGAVFFIIQTNCDVQLLKNISKLTGLVTKKNYKPNKFTRCKYLFKTTKHSSVISYHKKFIEINCHTF